MEPPLALIDLKQEDPWRNGLSLNRLWSTTDICGHELISKLSNELTGRGQSIYNIFIYRLNFTCSIDTRLGIPVGITPFPMQPQH